MVLGLRPLRNDRSNFSASHGWQSSSAAFLVGTKHRFSVMATEYVPRTFCNLGLEFDGEAGYQYLLQVEGVFLGANQPTRPHGRSTKQPQPMAYLETVKEITNIQGKVIGRIRENGPRQDIFDNTGTRLGAYDARTRETKDRTGRVVSRGASTLTNFLRRP